jgi:uncharacterized membrane protein YedE/YeeE
MVRFLASLASGLLFGLGLVISGMINPAKVLGFLDIAGAWDPSLALVMVGALIVAAPSYWLANRMHKPLCGTEFAPPARTVIDRQLIGGALLFGIGWGLVGYCPGPALASLGIGGGRTLLFIAAMLAGMAVFNMRDRLNRDRAPSVLHHGTARQPRANAARPHTR